MNRYAILRAPVEAREKKIKEARGQVAVYNKRMDEDSMSLDITVVQANSVSLFYKAYLDYKMFMSESGKSRSAGIYNGTEVNHGQTL